MKDKEYLYQPLLTLKLQEYYNLQSIFLTKPSYMYIYEAALKPDNKTPLKEGLCASLIPCPHTEWIIGYNTHNKACAFYCIGPVTKKRDYNFGNFDVYFGVRFSDNGCYFAKGVPDNAYPSGITDEIFEYSPSKDSFEYKLINELKSTDDFHTHKQMFIEFLNNSKSYIPVPENVAYMTDIIKKALGNILISDIAKELGYSERHICRLFKDTYGLSTKDYCKDIRFQNVLAKMSISPDENNSSYIYGAGYSDQAHFQREFKTFTGITPKKYMKILRNYNKQ